MIKKYSFKIIILLCLFGCIEMEPPSAFLTGQTLSTIKYDSKEEMVSVLKRCRGQTYIFASTAEGLGLLPVIDVEVDKYSFFCEETEL